MHWKIAQYCVTKFWSVISRYFDPPYHSRFKYDDTIGFRLDEENCPLCPKCLAESKATPGTYKSRRTLVCPIHGEVKGAKAVSKKILNKTKKQIKGIDTNTAPSNNIDGVFVLLTKIEKKLRTDWPQELPQENSPGFWREATRYESALRSVVSHKIELLFDNKDFDVSNWSALETWLYLRRVDFILNVLLEAAERKVDLKDEPRKALRSFLLEMWDECGALAFWNFAMERDGKPSPDANPLLVEIIKSS